MKRILHIYFLIIILLANACSNTKKQNTEPNGEEHKNIGVHIAKAQFIQAGMQLGSPVKKAFPEVINTTGIIDVPPKNRAVVSAIMGGYIKSVSLLVGDKVRKGQALLTIENQEFVTLQQKYLEAKNELTYLKAEYERQNTLVAENITSKKNFLKAESNYKKTKAVYHALDKQLHMLNISPKLVAQGNITTTAALYAPIKGSITKVNVVKGTYVTPTTEILEIVNNDHIHLDLVVFEKDIMKVRKGQAIQFRIPESSNEVFDASVYLVGTSIDANRTIKVHGHLADESKGHFLTGMFVNAQILVRSEDANATLPIALPEESIIEVNGKYVVLKLKEQKEGYVFEKVEIQVGKTSNGYTEIKSNHISKSDQVLVKGAFNLIDIEVSSGNSH
ncbi:efflux RND transporter periplasmic adaptor subunit [Flavivirga eckloniae]|uniref:Efflux transporter periplasmic adaptor subunit n=1 Tax=Flavivirga eckloniae TaxID=1803846 RepID=A0A2K9PTM2_9FLAO|nr:efflux RND transporter periplasmic adaptor subunit [Flavivirga eckloniae]AUP80168.1 efflux transporter periplasmic adaptor subunit [Flavivirga eckloniae]